jgi:plastocyanin
MPKRRVPKGRYACLLLSVCFTLGATIVPAAADTVKVTIDKLTFSPADIKAKVGDTVEWINHDMLAHTATWKKAWEVIIPPQKTESLKLTEAGTMDYYCRYHPNMKARIVVTAK